MVDETKKELKLPAWAKAVKKDSVKKSLDAGVIYPTLKPQLDRTYNVRVLSKEPKEIKTKLGKALALVVNYNGMNWSLIIPVSFQHHLTTEGIRKGFIDENGNTNFEGVDITFQKTEQEHEIYGTTEMYTVYID